MGSATFKRKRATAGRDSRWIQAAPIAQGIRVSFRTTKMINVLEQETVCLQKNSSTSASAATNMRYRSTRVESVRRDTSTTPESAIHPSVMQTVPDTETACSMRI